MDIAILEWIHANWHQSEVFNRIMKGITVLGNAGVMWIAIGVVMLFFKKTRRGGLVMLISLAIGFLLNDIVIKPLVARPRPFEENPTFLVFLEEIGLKAPSGYSFPSGHSFSSINCAVVLTYFFKKKGLPAVFLALVIAFSRAFVLVHYPTDILMGLIFGVCTAFSVIAVYRKIIEKKENAKTEQENS